MKVPEKQLQLWMKRSRAVWCLNCRHITARPASPWAFHYWHWPGNVTTLSMDFSVKWAVPSPPAQTGQLVPVHAGSPVQVRPHNQGSGHHLLLAWATAFIWSECWKRYLAVHHRRWLVNKIKPWDQLKLSSNWYPHTRPPPSQNPSFWITPLFRVYCVESCGDFFGFNERCKMQPTVHKEFTHLHCYKMSSHR